jgi:alkanesulfonate monooxygenase SsuD/methylene tetrahydromethanopterin reductase-like flavin-dependent oxidoreductase (luciferase family)
MEFGVFDHLDKNDTPLSRYYRERLEVIEAYERAGFYAYHVAEHHLTDLGMAPSPSVFLAAVAQRTTRLRFGPMIYAAPLYHPLRLLQEICMLDQMSAGRLEMGFGRGAAAAEIRFFDVDPAQTEKRYEEVVGFILEGLREGAVTVSEEGGRKRRMPLAIPPFQKPHPPLWYGIHSPEAAERVARRGMNVIGLDTVGELAPSFGRFRAVWKETRGEAPLPKIGIGRFVFVARSAGEALATARRAYRRWHESFVFLSRLMGWKHKHPRPQDFDAIAEDGRAFAGTPEAAAEYVQAQMRDSGANYFVGQFAFGDLTQEETLRSIGLFAEEVMPMLQRRKQCDAH